MNPSQPEEKQPKQIYFRVQDWQEASTLVRELTANGKLNFGSADRYPEDYTAFHKDAWSGQGMGYFVMRVENGKHVELVADISIGKKPQAD